MRPIRTSALSLGLALLATSFTTSSLTPTAAARCAVVRLPAEASDSEYVVEAVLERAGSTAHFRTVAVWKGGRQAPARFSLGAQRGRGRWPWAETAYIGRTYLLFLRPGPGFRVTRCGQSREVSDRMRDELRAEGLTRTER
jgi:hypothetical protein